MRKFYSLALMSLIAILSSQVTFAQGEADPGNVNSSTEGALNGLFTINANGDQVQFSQGNLQYQASTKTWRFADDQTKYLDRAANIKVSPDNTTWIDLFGWGTGNNPTLATTDAADYATFTDWGVNAISNGGNQPNQWRTLSSEEWMYLLHERQNAEEKVGFGTAKRMKGLIILPDEFTLPQEAGVPYLFYSIKDKNFSWMSSSEYYYNASKDNYSHNTYDVEQWSNMESAGAVFLPVTGLRIGTEMDYVSNTGFYWTSSAKDATHSYSMRITQQELMPFSYGSPSSGHGVRLVLGGDNNAETTLDRLNVSTANAQKIVRDGQVFILRDGKTYNLLGAEVK